VAGTDAAPFVQVVWHKRGENAIRPGDASRVLEGYLSGMQQLVQYLDRHAGGKA
jgi:hypothetical protein